MLCLGTFLNSSIKEFFQIPRPPIEHLVPVNNPLGFPSGHTQNVALAWTILAVYFKKPWLYIWTPIAVILTASSRMYLGVHSPLDVTVGASLGLLLAWSYFKFKNSKLSLLLSHKPYTPLAVTSLALALYATQMYQQPDPGGVRLAGMLLGLAFAYLFDPNLKKIEIPFSLFNKLMIASFGIASFFFIQNVIKLITPEPSTSMKFIIHIILGFYAFFGVTKLFNLFQKIIAQKEEVKPA